MKKVLMILVSVSAVALLGGCVSLEEFNRNTRQLESEQEANAALAEENRRLEGEVNKLRGDNVLLEKSLEDIKAASSTSKADLTDQLKDIWKGANTDEWEIIRNGNAMGVRLDDSGVLFQSGSWTLTDNTKSRLSKLADIMKGKMANPNIFCRIDGHTDTDPINKLKGKGIKDNVHLSTMRAMAVRDFMVSKGLPKDRIFVAGFGENWPIAGGNNSAAKQRNRRVEVYMGEPDGLSIGLPSKTSVQK
jgi:chemotaxis protein MotB